MDINTKNAENRRTKAFKKRIKQFVKNKNKIDDVINLSHHICDHDEQLGFYLTDHDGQAFTYGTTLHALRNNHTTLDTTIFDGWAMAFHYERALMLLKRIKSHPHEAEFLKPFLMLYLIKTCEICSTTSIFILGFSWDDDWDLACGFSFRPMNRKTVHSHADQNVILDSLYMSLMSRCRINVSIPVLEPLKAGM